MKVFVTNLITFLVDGGSQAQSIFSVLLNYVFALFIFIKWFSSGQMHFIPSWCCLWDCFLLNILIPFPWWHHRGRPASGAWRSYLILSWKSMHIELSTLSAAAAAKSLQSCPTLHDPIGGSPPGSPIPGILQARTLEWVAISFSNTWKWKMKVKSLSRVRLFATPWTTAYQAPTSMGFSRQEYWSGVPLPSPICRWHHPNGRKRRGSKDPLE